MGNRYVVLGINCLGSYDISAAIIIDGEIIAAVEEERLDRIRYTSNFPLKSINYCLEKANVKIEDLDSVAISGDPSKYIFEFFLPLAIQHPKSNTFHRNLQMAIKHYNIERTIREALNYSGPIRFYNHHFTHWASVFYPSSSNESAVLSVDGVGESNCSVMGIINKDELKVLSEVRWPNSLGVLYNAISFWCGFGYKDSGKTMGLAAYGKPSKFIDYFDELITLHNDGTYSFDPSSIAFGFERGTWFKGKFLERIGPRKNPDTDPSQREMNLAYALQDAFNKTMLHMLNYLYEQTKLKDICIVGGCAYNCTLNGMILNNTKFKRVIVQPAAGDAGTSIGGALLDYHKHCLNPLRMIQKNTYFGPEYETSEIKNSLEKSELKFFKIKNPSEKAAVLLSEGHIIGWFQGRMEFGPRALGNRSILAPPYPLEIRDRVNRDVKHREYFRPFAPATIDEKYNDYFEQAADTRYMIVNALVKQESKSKIPAVVHVDNTVRIQSVNEKINDKYYNLIKKFGDLTGIYVVLNTSFNDKGMPIVCSPDDAIQCFTQTELNHMIIGDYYVTKL